MHLRITKNTGKPHVILYKRDEGSETWMAADEFFVRHDLSHYAIEKTLDYRTAFMGMLNNGMDIKDFEDRAKRAKIPLTAEAIYSENMANLFLMEIFQGEVENFNQMAADAFVDMGAGIPPVQLSPDQLADIRIFLRQLLSTWKDLPAGQTMILDLDLQTK